MQNTSGEINGQKGLNIINKANYVRFVVDKFLPKENNKAMWLDTDTVITCDVVSLVNGILNDNWNVIAAVPREGPLHGLTEEGELKYGYIHNSFNAGVYVINLTGAQDMSESMRQIAIQNRERLLYNYGSQPPMTTAIEDKFEHLPSTWNVVMPHVWLKKLRANS